MDLRKLPPIDLMSMVEIFHDLPEGEKLSFSQSIKPPYLMPEITPLLGEESFFFLGGCWSPKQLQFFLRIDAKFSASHFPEVEKGEGVELFIDTRPGLSSGSINKYCHHFVFLPTPVEGIQAAEVTRFKNDDRHNPAPHEEFTIISRIKADRIEMEITIPEICLFGYNPAQVAKLGFACRVHRKSGGAGHFPVSGNDFKIETAPALWAKLNLV